MLKQIKKIKKEIYKSCKRSSEWDNYYQGNLIREIWLLINRNEQKRNIYCFLSIPYTMWASWYISACAPFVDPLISPVNSFSVILPTSSNSWSSVQKRIAFWYKYKTQFSSILLCFSHWRWKSYDKNVSTYFAKCLPGNRKISC